MGTRISKIESIQENEILRQGDIFKDVKYNYIISSDESTVDIEECIFPHAIIISQACDVDGASKLIINKFGKATKYMPSVLLCPIYDENTYRYGGHLDEIIDTYFRLESSDSKKEDPKKIYNSDERNVVRKNKHCRFHFFSIYNDNPPCMENLVIDFKNYFSLPIPVLLNQRENRIGRLKYLDAEDITIRFCSYLSRVAFDNDDISQQT